MIVQFNYPGDIAPAPTIKTIEPSNYSKAFQDPVHVDYITQGSDFISVAARGGNGGGPYVFAISKTTSWSDAIGGWFYQDNLDTTLGEKTFSDLDPGATYYLFAYRVASSTHYESKVSAGLIVTIPTTQP